MFPAFSLLVFFIILIVSPLGFPFVAALCMMAFCSGISGLHKNTVVSLRLSGLQHRDYAPRTARISLSATSSGGQAVVVV